MRFLRKMKFGKLAGLAVGTMVVGSAVANGEPAVGYMLDISRDKVPTMASLYRMADVLAELGYNQFQLYTEHTFAYRGHETVWRNASPMTPEEIRALDAYCAKKGIELVPNQNSFGHLEKWLRWPSYRRLAEAPEGGVRFWGTPRAYPCAICPTDPKSLEFIRDLYDQLLPNFRSKLFNVGCDEVMELMSDGKGRSWDTVSRTSEVAVWLGFFRKLCAEAEKRGRTAMFWDDMIVRKHPELIPELPENSIALEWGYEIRKGHDATAFERNCTNLEKCGRRFYVCPGTSGWNAMTGRHFNMKTNVDEAVSAGLRHGAEGFLMCDWGNGGMCQPWVAALPSLVYMRAKVDGRTLTDEEIAARIDALTGCRCGKALIRYQNLYRLSGTPNPSNRNSLYWFMSCRGRAKELTDERLEAVFAELAAARRDLDLSGAPDWVRDGFATMDLLCETLRLRWKGEHDRIVRVMPPQYRELWLRYNRPGGLDDSVKQNFRPPHVAEVVVSFDTEDYTCAKNADGIRDLTRICVEEDVVAHHQVVGELANKLVEWGRTDVIDLMRDTFIGTQTRYHTLHPDILELSDEADYATAYRRVREQEEDCVGILRRVFGVDRIWSSCPPGNSESYVANRVYADLGIPFDLGAGFLEAKDGDIWYGGQRRIRYEFNFEVFLPQARERIRRLWPEDRGTLLDAWAQLDRFCLYCHPNKVHSTEFWDALNYRCENKAKWGEWTQPKMRDPQEAAKYLSDVRGVLRALREDPRFAFRTLPELAAVAKPRVPITAKDLRQVRKDWSEGRFGPVRTPSWCVADVFCAAVAILRGEKSYLPKDAFGFLSCPYSTLSQTDVTRTEIVAAAKAMDVSGFLPSAIDLGGGKQIGPRQFLYAALEFLATDVDRVTVAPCDQLGPFAPVPKLEFRTHRNTWLHCPPPVFEDAYASDRLRWQLWTLRYE